MQRISSVLVTGANGFVGRALSDRLESMGCQVTRVVRRGCLPNEIQVGDIGPMTDWRAALDGCDSIVHLAARVHVMHDTATNPMAEFRRVNVEGTLHLARQAATKGVRRFVFLSSIKVNGESSLPDHPFTAEDLPAPQDCYAISKREAEDGLRALAADTGMEVVIVRPPLVYGPGVKANFAALMCWVARGLPLPLGAATCNRRSLLALDNLVDLLITCINHPTAANQTFLVSDGEDLSTTDLLRRMGRAMGKPARLLPVPLALLRLGATLVRKPDIYQRLCGSLQIDITKTCQLLDWRPPVGVDEGLRRVIPRSELCPRA